EMAANISSEEIEAVVFVDAAAQASIHGIQISRVKAEPASPSSGHHLDPSTLLVYASLLYGRQPPAWLVTVPGVDFAHGEGFSPEVTRWLTNDIAAIGSRLCTEILTEVRESTQCTNLELPNVCSKPQSPSSPLAPPRSPC